MKLPKWDETLISYINDESYELYIDTDLQILVLVIGLISADLNLTILPSCGDLIISAFDGLFSLDE